MILVTGARGNVGAELVRTLADAGERVRALVRDPKAATLPAGVEAVTGDLNEPTTLKSVLAGVDSVFLLPGFRDMDAVLAEVHDAEIRRVVLLSGTSVLATNRDNAVSAYMIRSEDAVRASGIAFTILRPSGFMSNTLQWIPQLATGDTVRAPFASVPIAMLDPLDIAAVAAIALTRDGHAGKVYRLTGPESLLPEDRVRILGDVLGRRLRFAGQPDDEARAEMSAAMPAEYVAAFFSFYADGTLDESQVLPTVAELTGRPARSFEDWARTHADMFRDASE